ncbi:MAG: coiled-coil domain-containing protein [Candidatus Thorarchaeota archaeon]
MSDPNERLREKTMQVTQLNQRLESMQAQLSGAQRRASELHTQVQTLETQLASKDSEMQALQAELSKTKAALDAVGREMQGIRSQKTEEFARQKPREDNTTKEELKKADLKIVRLKDDIKKLSEAATGVLLGQEGALDNLGEVVKSVGDIQHRIFNLILERRHLKIDEIASLLLIETAEVLDAVDSLQALGEVEMKDSNTVVPAKKYREVAIPHEKWKDMRPAEIFDSLEEIVEKAEGKETIVEALEKAVDILEQKLARGGALIFQMRRTAGDWNKQEGNAEELRYTIRDWRSRAISLQ